MVVRCPYTLRTKVLLLTLWYDMVTGVGCGTSGYVGLGLSLFSDSQICTRRCLYRPKLKETHSSPKLIT